MNQLPGITQIIIDTFSTLIHHAVDFFPRLVYCLLILLIGYFVAKSVSVILKKILENIGFNKIGDRLNKISVIQKLRADIKLSNIVATIAYYFILIIFLPIATEALGIDAITNMILNLVNYIPKIIAAIIMLQVGLILSDAVKGWIVTLCQSFNIPAAKLIGNVFFGFFLIITLLSSLSQIGINTELLESSFILVLGGVIAAFAIGYGLASKDVLSNLISSFYTKQKYRVGQYIKIGDTQGHIVKVDKLFISIETEKSVINVPLRDFQTYKVEIFNTTA
jgi:hypothetical protein